MSREPHQGNGQGPDEAAREGISRREFILRAGATGALLAGAAAGGYALWQPKHFIPGFQPEKGLQLPSYALEPSKTLPTLAIAHGTDHDKTIRAALGALGGMERFIKKGDV